MVQLNASHETSINLIQLKVQVVIKAACSGSNACHDAKRSEV
jgi:hypothetical protein